jgi:hypothetical protein
MATGDDIYAEVLSSWYYNLLYEEGKNVAVRLNLSSNYSTLIQTRLFGWACSFEASEGLMDYIRVNSAFDLNIKHLSLC